MLTTDQQIFEQIKKAKNILITFDKTWNGDSIASALAFYLFLKKLDKKVEIAAEKFDQGSLFNFLPTYGNINYSLNNLRKFVISLDTINTKVEKIKYKIKDNTIDFIIYPKEGFFTHEHVKSNYDKYKYDLIIVLDTPDLESLGKIYEEDTEFFYQVPVINIDHHVDNEEFGQINNVELTAISTSEILFNLFSKYSRDLIDHEIATCLLTGIISKTKNYKTQNITPGVLQASSQLIAMGADREKIVNRLYRSRSIDVLKLWGRVLARLTGSKNNKLIWSILTDADFQKTNTNENDLNEVIDELVINIPEAKIVILFYEINGHSNSSEEKNTTGEIKTKALIYSIKNANSLDLVKKWNPAGTKSIAKIIIPKNIKDAETEVINHVKGYIEKILS